MPWYQAPAKINLGLWVGSRDDAGFHPIDSIMQTVALLDQLYIEPRDTLRWESSSLDLPMDGDNLVVRAYYWAKQWFPDLPPVYARLNKVVWAGAGLGGGSSDAAAMLRWAFGGTGRLKDPALVSQIGDSLGMDVPFFLTGGTARVRHYGEQLTQLPTKLAAGVVLANPAISLATQEVYRAYDIVVRERSVNQMDDVERALTSGTIVDGELLHNDLEPAAFVLHPPLRDFRDRLVHLADGAPVVLSGSGPTYYILGVDENWAEWMARRLRRAGIPRVEATTVLEAWS